MDIKTFTEYVIPLLTLCGVIFEAGRTRAKIDHEIAQSKALFVQGLDKLQGRLDIHLTDFGNKQEMIVYRLTGLDEKINHKFERLHKTQKDIQTFLEKSGFVPRDY
jgi:hypothetical protein